MAFALIGARVFTGEAFLDRHAVVVDGRHIRAVIPHDQLAADIMRHDLKGGILAPGFVDVQVNGGGGALLNQNPSVAVVNRIAQSHRAFGTTGILPTVITDTPDVIACAIAAVREARQQKPSSVLGIHVEGPFLDVARKGAHDPKFIRQMTPDDIAHLAQAGCGHVMLTVAPNKVPPPMIKVLVEAGVIVSLGHAEACYADATAALDAGARSFTHLFNAMSQLTGREPGMVGAALSHTNSFIGVIADGHHVHDASLKLAFASTSSDRFMLVSDAMPPAAGGPDRFELQGRAVTRVAGRLQLDDGTLAGSNLTMDEAVRYCVSNLQVPLATALQMASRNPARFLCRSDLGIIAPGALASLAHLDDTLNVQKSWVEGQ
jgi:N-acetylglucosamine-6-phosphate deacetylase